jgi:glycosyltransferase involved in cell wall biosynthesis
MPQAPLAPLRHLTMFALGPLILLRVARQHRTCVFIAQSPYEAAVGGVVKLWLRRCGGSAALIVETMGDFENAFFLYRRVPFQRPARWLMRRVATFGLRHADLGRAISAATERQLATAAPALPIDRFPAWVDIEALRTISRSAPPSSSRDVLYVGALARIKGVHVLIDAFAAALPAATPARLVIVGPESNISYAHGLRTKVRALGIEARIVFAGERSSDEVAQLMSRARIVAVPSLSEGLSRVTLEAMAVGTPVVASRVGGIPDLVVDNETGWLVSPNDAGALADGLRRAFAGPAVDALGARARQRAYTLASADAYVAGHRRLLAAAQKIVRGERAG